MGGNDIVMRHPKILVEVGVVKLRIIWKIKKAPVAWEAERDKPLKSLSWNHDGQA